MSTAGSSPRGDDGYARFVSMLSQGRREADSDRPVQAERLFRRVLHDARGTSAERLACSHLAKLYVRQGRSLEALIAARRMVELSEREGSSEDRAFAWTGVVCAIADLCDFARIDAPAAALESALDAYDGVHSAALRRSLHRLRALAAIDRGELPLAVAEFELAKLPAPGIAPADEVRERHVVAAQVEFASGEFERARASLALAREIAAPLGNNALTMSLLDMRCALAIDGAAAAIEPGRRLLELLAAPGASSFGTAHRLDSAHRAGVFLHRKCRILRDARSAFDLAAVASAAAFAELARCSGEGGSLTPEEGSLVAAFRDRLDASRRALAADVATLLRDVEPRTLPVAPAIVGLCVTCDRARLPDGSMVPFPALARTRRVDAVGYGVCEPCSVRRVG